MQWKFSFIVGSEIFRLNTVSWLWVWLSHWCRRVPRRERDPWPLPPDTAAPPPSLGGQRSPRPASSLGSGRPRSRVDSEREEDERDEIWPCQSPLQVSSERMRRGGEGEKEDGENKEERRREWVKGGGRGIILLPDRLSVGLSGDQDSERLLFLPK